MHEINAISRHENTLSLEQLAVKLHFQAYRACCRGMTNITVSVFDTLSSSLNRCVQLVRKVNVIDICMMTSLKVVNGAYITIFKEQLISKDSLKTLAQKKRELEIVELKQKLSKKPVYSDFSEATAHYLYAIIPRYIGEQLNLLSMAAESWILFKLGYIIRYCNYQVKKRWHYDKVLATHKMGKLIQRQYLGFGSQIIQTVMHKNHVNPILDFEHLFLNLFVKLATGSKSDNQKTAEAIVKSLALSFSQQKEIDHYLDNLKLSEEEAIIARLEWHKTQQNLPKGLPDPHLVRLTKQNLQENLDEALNSYLEEKIEKFLKKICPQQLKRGLAGLLYFLEGQDILVKLFSYLIAELGIKQVIDPHLFALAILNGSGVEVMDYELDGFGRDKRQLILKTGQKMMANAVLEKYSSISLIKTFEESGLKHSPGSLEGIFQKREVKEQLKKYISFMLHKTIKPEHFQHPESVFKMTREKMDQLPLIGTASISLHLLINGTLFFLGYPFRHKAESDVSLPSWLFRHLSGKKLTDQLAERIVELIYHPSWRITLLQLIEILTAEDQKEEKKENTLKEDLQHITDFLFKHFTQSFKMPFRDSIGSWIEHFSGDTVLKLFLESIQPKETSMLEKGLKSFLPTIKELLLYTHVINSFRQESVLFEGDAKFWEYFIRESLNQHLAIQVQKKSFKPSTLSEIFAMREQMVEKMLSLDKRELREMLSKLPQNETVLDSQQWEIIPKEVLEDEFYIFDPDSFNVQQ